MSSSRRISPQKRLPPLSVRFNLQELEVLRRRAGNLPLSTYVKQAALGPAAPVYVTRHTHRLRDGAALGRALATLGESGLAQNLDSLADAARLGILPPEPDTGHAILRACWDVQSMRELLMAALGVGAEDEP